MIVFSKLYLVDHGFMSGLADDVISLPGIKIGKSQSSDKTFVHQSLHGCPGVSVMCVRVTDPAVFSSRHQLLPLPETHTLMMPMDQ